jgi:hypothetical protein
MNAIDDRVMGSAAPMPRLGAVRAIDGGSVRVDWLAGARAGRADTVSLLPLLDSFKFYDPLRRDAALFASVHVIDDGNAIAWGDDDGIDMAATSIERLAEEAMTAGDFAAFLKRNKLTHQAAAAVLGRSRRQIEYYLKEGVIPRTIALACFGYEARRSRDVADDAGKRPAENKTA